MRLLTVLSLAACVTSAAADVYRWTDDDGTVIFSDTPQPGAVKIEIREPTVVPAQELPRRTTRLSPPQAAFSGYEAITVVSPTSEQTVRNVQSIAVSVRVEPALRTTEGHRVQLYYDGEPYGAARGATTFTVDGLERGAHQIAAAVVDADGNELVRSGGTEFFVHQHSVLNP